MIARRKKKKKKRMRFLPGREFSIRLSKYSENKIGKRSEKINDSIWTGVRKQIN